MTAGAWRTAVADALDEQVDAIEVALAELENVHAVLEARGNTKLCSELRGLAAGLRCETTDMAAEARTLRAKPADDGHGFPITLTSRYPRRELEP